MSTETLKVQLPEVDDWGAAQFITLRWKRVDTDAVPAGAPAVGFVAADLSKLGARMQAAGRLRSPDKDLKQWMPTEDVPVA